MALQRKNLNINFSQGLETKTDPKQIPFGKFLLLRNTVFTTPGLAQKRNGNAQLSSLPSSDYSYVTTFKGDLAAIGDRFQSYSSSAQFWTDKGFIQPLQLSVLSLIRSNTNQSQVDSTTSLNGFICTVYTDQNTASLGANQYKYQVSDSTGTTIVAPTVITGADATVGFGKVFLLGDYFIIIYTNKVGATYHLQYIAISTINPNNVIAATDISASYFPNSTGAFDAGVFNDTLYIAWNGAAASGIKMAYLTSQLALSPSIIKDGSHVATIMSVAIDSMNEIIWVSYYDLGSTVGYSLAVSPALGTVLAATLIIPNGTILNLTSAVSPAGTLNLIYEVSNAYSYDGSIPTHYVKVNTLTQAGVLGTSSILLRSVGLASKAFILDDVIYFLLAYQSPYQSTYFLTNLSGQLVAKLAYGNGTGYLPTGLPSVSVSGTTAILPYLLKTTIAAVNKNTNVAAGTQVAGIYSQTGINLASFNFETAFVNTSEIGSNLLIPGGFLWMYDGSGPVEQGFHLWPDSVEVTTATGGGGLVAQTYFYQVTYEWSDDEGNLFRSAPSIPVSIVTTTATSTNTINVPTLRLTYKTANPVKIVVYRWSTAQQIYYQVTSIATPTLNSLTVDSVAITDANADATILGNNILYTNGGVLENTGGPACKQVTLFDDRFFAITAEDDNVLAYSKQVIRNVPVELSDLLTFYVAPTIGAEGSTGPLQCFAPMDDKLILWKNTAIYYINGTGPDNTGSNNQYSQPVFITATVGSDNQNSIAYIPNGIMFQSPTKGIWLLKRDLSTRYVGSPVEAYNEFRVLSTDALPGTNFVLFTLSNGLTLMYDYFVDQWGVWKGNPAISSCLFQNLYTVINSLGQVFQETPGLYLDGANPISMGFITGWFNLAGLQGYQRAYFFFLLAKYLTPHFLQIGIAYDYADAISQGFTVYPPNYTGPYGSDPTYGQSLFYGGSTSLEQFRLFFETQKCQAFQITVNELYDATLGVPAGAGLTFSGLNMVYGSKKGYPSLAQSQGAG